MSDEELIARFEAGAVPEAEFHHQDHVRLAFAYLRTGSVLDALQRFSSALKQFATRLGKADRYHETITFAYFFLIHERMARMGPSAWQDFAAGNPDLLEKSPGILGRYYSDGTLQSDLARRTFVLPDQFLRDRGTPVIAA